jgi:hypothetical protein
MKLYQCRCGAVTQSHTDVLSYGGIVYTRQREHWELSLTGYTSWYRVAIAKAQQNDCWGPGYWPSRRYIWRNRLKGETQAETFFNMLVSSVRSLSKTLQNYTDMPRLIRLLDPAHRLSHSALTSSFNTFNKGKLYIPPSSCWLCCNNFVNASWIRTHSYSSCTVLGPNWWWQLLKNVRLL